MSQENPFHNETTSRLLGRPTGASAKLWGELEIMHPGNPKAQLRTWIDQTTELIRSSGRDSHALEHEVEGTEKLYREAMVGLCRRAGLSQPDTAAELLLLMSEGATAARQYEGPEEPSDRFRKVAEATVARFSQRQCRQTMFTVGVR